MTTGPKFYSPELEYMNNPPPYQYLEIKDPLMKDRRMMMRKGQGGKGSDIRSKLKNMTLRDYIGADNFRYNTDAPENNGSSLPQPDGM